MNERIREAAEHLAGAVRESRAYRRYLAAREALADTPELLEEIGKLRLAAAACAEDPNVTDLSHMAETLGEEASRLRANPAAAEFLAAEEELAALFTETEDLFYRDMDLFVPEEREA